jgi:hypothetical protein
MRRLVGRNVRRLRLERGLTQEQYAVRSGFSQQYISGLEQGQRNPTVVSPRRSTSPPLTSSPPTRRQDRAEGGARPRYSGFRHATSPPVLTWCRSAQADARPECSAPSAGAGNVGGRPCGPIWCLDKAPRSNRGRPRQPVSRYYWQVGRGPRNDCLGAIGSIAADASVNPAYGL